MTGYQEILTDPSYKGQTITMTYPLIGNYGVAEEDDESDKGWAEAFVVKEMSSIHSNRRADLSLSEWLGKKGIVTIEGVDTRRITRAIRTEGCLRCVVSTVDPNPASLGAKARTMPATDGRDLASAVTAAAPFTWAQAYDPSYPTLLEGTSKHERRIRCVALDFGAKRNILRSLVHAGFDVTVVPAWTNADEVLALDPAGIFLSNGPGDPSALGYAVQAVSDLVKSGIPIMCFLVCWCLF